VRHRALDRIRGGDARGRRAEEETFTFHPVLRYSQMSESKLPGGALVWSGESFFRRRVSIALLYIMLIAAAELLTAYAAEHGGVFARFGLVFHGLVLFALFTHSALILRADPETSKLLLALILAPLIRIFSLAMPVVQFSYIAWFSIISIPVYLTIFTCVYLQHIKPRDIGLTLPAVKHLPLEFAIILLAVPLGVMEYYILQPGLLVAPRLAALVVPVLVMVVCTGFLEELTFRGLMQYHATRTMGFTGIVLISALFGVLHIGNLTILDVLLTGSIGFIFSLVVRKTGSLYGVSISHGIINTTLFLIAPAYL
jgi:membrane protease YdiL (CAAX protease family)